MNSEYNESPAHKPTPSNPPIGEGLVTAQHCIPFPTYHPILSGIIAGLEPDEDLNMPDWADKYRKLPRESTHEYGDYRVKRTPYMHEPLMCLSPRSPVKNIVVVKPTQIGATDGLGNNFLLYTAHKKPRPCLTILPTVELARRHVKSKMDKSLAAMECMHGIIRDAHGGKKRDESILLKEFPGGFWMFLGANSASAARSVSICNLILDDVDGFVMELGDEGDPIDIIKKRTDAFSAIAKILLMSTPTTLETSRIWAEFLLTDQCYYYVPCPFCDHGQTLQLGGPDTDYGLKWKDNDPDTAQYLCEQCHTLIPEIHKTRMLEQGKWIPTNPKVKLSRGFQLSSFYSPYGWVSWSVMAKEFLDSYKEPRKLKVYYNTRLGLPFEERGQQPEWTLLKNRSEPYKYWYAPEHAGFVTAGVDVQRNRLAVVIKGWGRNEESWLIWWGEVFGDTTDTESTDVWDQLDGLISRPITHALGFELPVLCTAIDSSDNTHVVYNFVRKRSKYIAIKGQSQTGKPILGRPTKQDVNYKGCVIKDGVELWPVGTDTAKRTIYDRLEAETPAHGRIHFTLDAPDDYYRQLTAEKHVTRYDKFGFGHKEWFLPKHKRNEALDCEVYALAAAIKVGLLHMNWDNVYTHHKNLKERKIQESTTPIVPTAKPHNTRQRYPSKYMRR